MNQKLKLVFLGTADFACPALEKLINHPQINLLGLITQPDKPVGRKQIITAPSCKLLALKYGFVEAKSSNKIGQTQVIWQPEKLSKDTELIEELKKLKPDFLITAAYGQILKKEILDLAPVINLHASLLPKFRGPAPINWMIIHGETRVGISTMLSDEGIDTGDILLSQDTTLGENENALELSNRLALMGADLLIKTLGLSLEQHNAAKEYSKDEQSAVQQNANEHSKHNAIISKLGLKPQKQDLSNVPSDQVLAPFMDRNLGLINFANSEMVLGSANPRQADFKVTLANNAQNIHNLVRGTQPWPGAHFMHNGTKISVLETRVEASQTNARGAATSNLATNLITLDEGSNHILAQAIAIDKNDESLIMTCFDGSLIKLLKVKPEGRNAMSGMAWYNGLR